MNHGCHTAVCTEEGWSFHFSVPDGNGDWRIFQSIVPIPSNVSIVSVADRSPETCLVGFGQGRKVVHLTACISTPHNLSAWEWPWTPREWFVPTRLWSCITRLQRMVFTETFFEECTCAKTRDISDVVLQCEILCYNLRPEAEVITIGIRLQNLSWKFKASGKLCVVTVTSN